MVSQRVCIPFKGNFVKPPLSILEELTSKQENSKKASDFYMRKEKSFGPATYKIDTFIIINCLKNQNKYNQDYPYLLYTNITNLIYTLKMFTFNIIKEASFKIDEKIIDKIMKNVSNLVPKVQNGILNIVFLDSDSIKNLNNKYRKIDKATDVLSFHYFDNFNNLGKNEVAGEIIMSEEAIISQGITYGLGEEKEFYKLVIHSILHILGYDHENEKDFQIMQNFENLIWETTFGK